MSEQSVLLWEATPTSIIPNSAKSPEEISKYATLLRPRELKQILGAFSSEHYEMASTFVWSRAMAVLRKQLATLGSAFIGEMLQRPDIEIDSDLAKSVTDVESITLAEELGMVTTTEAMRLRNAHEVISHFSKFDADDEEIDLEVGMTPEEAVNCLRSTIQSILGRPTFTVAHDFAEFRKELEEKTFEEADPKIETLKGSPYFFKKTTLSILLALIKAGSGAQLEHSVRNTNLVVKLFWHEFRKSEKWQTGQTYAELYADGKKGAVKGLKQALTNVSGFDFVPENLRSNTFTKAANDVVNAHQSLNNFYNEQAPMEALAKLGTTIPGPAFPVCMSAALCVWLGNSYGHAWGAQSASRRLIKNLSDERWAYYLDDVLPQDRTIIYKLLSMGPAKRFIDLVDEFDLTPNDTSNVKIKRLIRAASKKNVPSVQKIAKSLYNSVLEDD